MVAAMPYPMAKASAIRVVNMVNALVNNYDDINVELFAYEGNEPPPKHPRLVSHLVGGFNVAKAAYYALGNKLSADLRILRALIARRRAIQIIHCHTIEGLALALAFKALTMNRAPICADMHGPIVPELIHYGLIPNWRPATVSATAVEALLLRFVGHVFASNEGLGRMLGERVGGHRVSVVFDYVDLERFDANRADPARVNELRQHHKAEGTVLITYVGMFKDYQGVDFLLRAFASIAASRSDIRLLLVGDGPCRWQYEELIEANGLAERVVMPGLVPHDDVVNWLEISDIVVSPRVDNEITVAGFVSQMPEYMAAGKLIVSTWVSGCGRLLRDGAGIIVAPNDVEALRRGLERALALSPAEIDRCVAQARLNVGQFTWKQGIADVYRVYRALLVTGRRST